MTGWFENLTSQQKDEAVEHALATMAKNTRLLELEANGGNNAEWYKLTAAVARSGAPHAEDIFVKHASAAKNADPEDALRSHFVRCRDKPGPITVGTLLHVARQSGADFDRWKGQASTSPGGQATPYSVTYPAPLSMGELMQGNFPAPEFMLKEHVNLLYGDGGTGKTLLALHMAVALASGELLFDLATKQADVLIVLAEDSYGATKDRLKAICGHFKIEQPEDLPIEIWCLPAHDISIASVTD
jgi:hypothetical protein